MMSELCGILVYYLGWKGGGRLEKDISAAQPQKGKNTWFSRKDEHSGWQTGAEEEEKEGTLAPDSFLPQGLMVGIPKKYRLSSKRLFKRIYREGKVVKNQAFVIYCLRYGEDKPQVAIVVSKKFGKAVKRNKIKRRIREIVRGYLPLLSGYGIIILPRLPVVGMDFWQMKEALEPLLDKVVSGDGC